MYQEKHGLLKLVKQHNEFKKHAFNAEPLIEKEVHKYPSDLWICVSSWRGHERIEGSGGQ